MTSDCLSGPATTKTLPLIQITPEPSPVLSPTATPWTPWTVTEVDVAYWIGIGMMSVVLGSPMALIAAGRAFDRPGMGRMWFLGGLVARSLRVTHVSGDL